MKRRVTQIVKGYTYTNNHPCSWLKLECGHDAAPILNPDLPWKPDQAHDDSYHLVKPGDEVDCSRCDHYQDQLARLRAMADGSMSHSRFRHHDSRGHGPGSLYVYKRVPGSPTGVGLELSIDDTPEAQAEVHRVCGTSPLSPTEKR